MGLAAAYREGVEDAVVAGECVMRLPRLNRIVVALLALALAGAVRALPVNLDFESGDLGGWEAKVPGGYAQVVTSHPPALLAGDDYRPQGGRYFLALHTGKAGVWQQVSQSFRMGAGETLSGMAAFDWGGRQGAALDGAKVEVFDARGALVTTAFRSDSAMAGYNAPWSPWSFTADKTGYYTLVLSVRSVSDDVLPSFGYFDVRTMAEPHSLSLVTLGLAAAGALRRLRS
jgi:hypothetical protein